MGCLSAEAGNLPQNLYKGLYKAKQKPVATIIVGLIHEPQALAAFLESPDPCLVGAVHARTCYALSPSRPAAWLNFMNLNIPRRDSGPAQTPCLVSHMHFDNPVTLIML